MISGERVRQARECCGLTQAELATRIGVSQPTISDIEAGRLQGSQKTIEKIATVTEFPVAFLEEKQAPTFPLGTLLYRARTAMTAEHRARAYRQAQLAFEFTHWLAGHANIPKVRVPEHAGDPTTAAALARAAMGLSPEDPIPHLTAVLERNGVIVLPLLADMSHLDAFATWVESDVHRPVIAVAQGRPGDRQRFSVAHELGHLIMHAVPRGPFEQLEREADTFAAEFLAPETAMRQEITTPVTLNSLANLKPRWRVSIQMLVRRAKDLGIITARQYHYLFQQIGYRGWRREEPAHLAVPIEKPRLLRKLAEVLYGTPIAYDQIAVDAKMPGSFVQKLLGSYATFSMDRESRTSQADVGKVVPIRPRRRLNPSANR